MYHTSADTLKFSIGICSEKAVISSSLKVTDRLSDGLFRRKETDRQRKKEINKRNVIQGFPQTLVQHTRTANGAFLMRRSVLFWYLRISISALAPGRNLLFFVVVGGGSVERLGMPLD